jgi:hypothetical protein
VTQFAYAATDLITGQVLADSIPLNVQSFSAQLNGGGTLTGTLNLDEDYPVNTPYIEALECRRCVLWVLADNYPVWNGVVWDWPDMSRQGGTLPISAQTMDSVFADRVIAATLEYPSVDIFEVFCDLVKYGTTLSSTYITTLSPVQGPPSPLVGAQAAIAGLILPAGLTSGITSGITWDASYTYSDNTQIGQALSDLVSAGNIEFWFQPGLDGSGNLITNLRLAVTPIGRDPSESGYALSYPGNVSDYGYQRTGSQGANVVIATAPPNGSAEPWQSQYPHGYDLADLEAGYPLQQTVVSWQGSTVTRQSQIDAFADGQVQLLTQAMTMPVVNVPDGVLPSILDLTLGDTIPFTATSALHPPGPNGSPGLQQYIRVAGYTAYPPGPSQSAYVQIAASGIVP